MQGYIKLHRSSQENILYFSEPFTKWQAWQDMLLIANHNNGWFFVRGIMVNIERGQLWHSEDTLATRWKWSRGKVRRFLEYLETIQQIVQHKSKVKSIISIINYDKYQWNDTTNSTTNGHQTVQQTDTNKNDKNEKEIKKKYGEFENVKLTDIEYDKLQKRFSDYLDKIESLSIYIKSKWDKYKDHYATIIARERKNKPPEPQTQEDYIKVFKEIWLLQFRKKYWQDKANEIMLIAI